MPAREQTTVAVGLAGLISRTLWLAPRGVVEVTSVAASAGACARVNARTVCGYCSHGCS